MPSNKKSVELLAPAGTWKTLIAAVEAGADAVYLGGKSFNMRVHDSKFNFDNETLKAAITFAHKHNVKIYVTINNLISTEEIPALKIFLRYLNEISPDAILVQDLAVIQLINELQIKIPIHASVMMNTHNFPTVELLKKFGVTRIVISREFTLSEISLLKARIDIEVEYFIHGDMCFSESGQCIHSGIIFGQSSNRGRCLKPCRWIYKLIDEDTGEVLSDFSYKLAIKDMCMFRNIPDLIQSGITSLKIEGRMRSPEFVSRLVSIYRREIDSYLKDPTGYVINETAWQNLFENRVRDYTRTFALGSTTVKDIGISGSREPKIFSKAINEPDFDNETTKEIFSIERGISKNNCKPKLTVRVSTFEAALAAIDSGADCIYVGGEIFRPQKPWTIAQLHLIVEKTHAAGQKVILRTPRISKDKNCAELENFFKLSNGIEFDGIAIGNLGTLNLVQRLTNIPIFADSTFNLFNYVAAKFLKDIGMSGATASMELSFSQVRSLVENSSLPIEIIVHGAIETMICDHDIAKFYLKNYDEFTAHEMLCNHYALVDEAGEIHSLRVDQFNRWHIFLGKDICLLPYIKKFLGASALRIEAQNYSVKQTAKLVSLYRAAIDGENISKLFEEFRRDFPQKFGAGIFKFAQSKNSIFK